MIIKNVILILLMQVFALSNLFAQQLDTLAGIKLDSLINSGQICFDPVPENDTIYLYVKQMPEFPGGKLALIKYIRNNFDYSIPAKISIDEGSIFIRFEICKTGEVGKIELQYSIEPIVDKEAIRVIRSLPKFKPGIKDGEPVNVWYSIPIKIAPD